MRRRVKRRRAQPKDEQGSSPTSRLPARSSRDDDGKQGSFYKAGAVVRLKEAGYGAVGVEGGQEQEEQPSAGPTPKTQGSGVPAHEEVHANSVRLEGRTDANYNGGTYHTENERVQQAEGCEGCDGANCIQVSGTLVATYSVTTTVTLPSIDDYPDLTPCQRRRVQDAINNVLAPHEQQHVRAFHQYDGTTRREFNLTLCRSEFAGRIREMFEAEESQRRAAAQATSDALDPFHFDVDLNCEDEQAALPEGDQGGVATAEPPAAEV